MSRFKGWTSKQFKADGLHATPDGKAKKLVPDKPQKPLTEKEIQKAIKKVSSKPKQEKSSVDPKVFIEYAIKDAGLKYETEYKFAPDRKFRSDWFLSDYKTLVEFEGIMSEKSRHTSVVGYSRDAEKYSLAAILGFKVIRYTVLNYRNVVNDLKQIVTRET